jgi:hypothetical protein
LDQKSLIAFELFQGFKDGVKAFPVPRGLPTTTVDHEVLRPFCHFGIEIVLKHAVRSFGEP